MSKHTPGPWEWSDKYRTSDNERNTWSLLGKDGYGILSCDGDANSPQSLGASGEANARLIAAAPELLEALNGLLDECEQAGLGDAKDFKWPQVISSARSAIAKAVQS